MEFKKICQIVSEQLNVDEESITMETSFTKDLNADSLDLFQIISELEETFDMEFENVDTKEIQTVGDAVNYIQKTLKQR